METCSIPTTPRKFSDVQEIIIRHVDWAVGDQKPEQMPTSLSGSTTRHAENRRRPVMEVRVAACSYRPAGLEL